MDQHRVLGPTTEELLSVVEKQDVIVDSLQEELALCKEQLQLMADNEKQRFESEQLAAKTVAETERKMELIMNSVETIMEEKKRLEKELEETKRRLEEASPIPSVILLKEKLKDAEMDFDREHRKVASLQLALETSRQDKERTQRELDLNQKEKNSAALTLSAKLEATTAELAEMRHKYQDVSNGGELQHTQLSSELELCRLKESHQEAHNKQLLAQLDIIRKERRALSSRCSSLLEENVSLRTKNETSSNTVERVDQSAYPEEIDRLLEDQRRLIAALKEENALLIQRLDRKHTDYKLKLKELKKQNKELEERINTLLKI